MTYLHSQGYIVISGERLEHVAIAEKAMGKAMPKGADVHHVDYNKTNNAPTNLVVCPSRAYHLLLHVRTEAYDACGNANWRRCSVCKKYDDPKNMYIRPNGGRADHYSCKNARQMHHYYIRRQKCITARCS